jgi:hypothetical protein
MILRLQIETEKVEFTLFTSDILPDILKITPQNKIVTLDRNFRKTFDIDLVRESQNGNEKMRQKDFGYLDKFLKLNKCPALATIDSTNLF